jgi:hypothetical protein
MSVAQNSINGTGGWSVGNSSKHVAKPISNSLSGVYAFNPETPAQYYKQSAPSIPNDITSLIPPPEGHGDADGWGYYTAYVNNLKGPRTTPFNNKIKGNLDTQYNQPAPSDKNSAIPLVEDFNSPFDNNTSGLKQMIDLVKVLLEVNQTKQLRDIYADLQGMIYNASRRPLTVDERTRLDQHAQILFDMTRDMPDTPDPQNPQIQPQNPPPAYFQPQNPQIQPQNPQTPPRQNFKTRINSALSSAKRFFKTPSQKRKDDVKHKSLGDEEFQEEKEEKEFKQDEEILDDAMDRLQKSIEQKTKQSDTLLDSARKDQIQPEDPLDAARKDLNPRNKMIDEIKSTPVKQVRDDNVLYTADNEEKDSLDTTANVERVRKSLTEGDETPLKPRRVAFDNPISSSISSSSSSMFSMDESEKKPSLFSGDTKRTLFEVVESKKPDRGIGSKQALFPEVIDQPSKKPMPETKLQASISSDEFETRFEGNDAAQKKFFEQIFKDAIARNSVPAKKFAGWSSKFIKNRNGNKIETRTVAKELLRGGVELDIVNLQLDDIF